MIKIKMDWMKWTDTSSKEVIMVQDKFFIVLLVGKVDKPTDVEAAGLLSKVLNSYQEFIKDPAHTAKSELIKVIEVEYYWDWEKDKKTGKAAGSLFDYPSFNGVVGMNYFDHENAEKLLTVLNEEFGK